MEKYYMDLSLERYQFELENFMDEEEILNIIKQLKNHMTEYHLEEVIRRVNIALMVLENLEK